SAFLACCKRYTCRARKTEFLIAKIGKYVERAPEYWMPKDPPPLSSAGEGVGSAELIVLVVSVVVWNKLLCVEAIASIQRNILKNNCGKSTKNMEDIALPLLVFRMSLPPAPRILRSLATL